MDDTFTEKICKFGLTLYKKLFKPLLKKNLLFKNSLKNEECYIIGNGQSLKYFDLKKLNKKKTISINYLHIHNDFNCLNIYLHIFLHPYIFWPFWKIRLDNNTNNPRKIYFNKTNQFLRDSCLFKKNYNLITSIANFPFLLNRKNTFYLHNFGNSFDFRKIDLIENFSFMQNSLFASIVIAYYCGCRKITLIGMDYLFEKPITGHFYEYQRQLICKLNEKEKMQNELFFNFFNKKISIRLVSFDNKKSNYIKVVNYSDLTNDKEIYKENYVLVSKDNLEGMKSIREGYIIN